MRLCAPGHLPRCRRTPARPAAHGSCHTPSASCTGGAFPGVLCSHDKSKSHASPQGSSGEGFQRPHADPLGWLGQRTRPLEERLTRGNPSHNETRNVSGFVAAGHGRDTGHNHPSCHLAHTCSASSGLACPPRASLKPKRNRSSEPQPCEGFTESPSGPCVSERSCLPKRRLWCHLLPCLRPTGARLRLTPLCTAVRRAVVTLVVGWGLGIFGSTAIPVVAPGASSTVSLVKGTLRIRN